MKFDPYGTMIHRGNRTLIMFHVCCCSKFAAAVVSCLRYLERKLQTLFVLSREKTLFKFFL